jgi:hypothetical protein
MDLESALLLLDALDNNGNVVDNDVTVEPMVNIPLNEISEQLDENQNIEKACGDFQDGLLKKSSSESENIVLGHKDVFADILMYDVDISIETEGTDINEESISFASDENDNYNDTDKTYTPNDPTQTSDEETEIDTA